jgi:hypothetical protein
LAATQSLPEREAEARRRADALLPRLSYRVLRITNPAPLLEIARNGIRLEGDALNHPIPVDPGAQEIRATAPEHSEWSLTITITQPGRHVVHVPELALRAPPTPAATSVDAAEASSAQRPTRSSLEPHSGVSDRPHTGLPVGFWVAAGSTAIATGVTAVAGVMSLTSYNEAERQCETRENCSDAAITARNRAGTQATIANVAAGTAIVAAGVGVYLFVTSRSARRDRAGAALRIAAQPALSWGW